MADRLGGIPKREKRKAFLTLEEVKQLAATPCQYDVLKRAALFSCLTGLRISDEALELCGEVQGEGVVFAGLRRCMIQHPLHAWIKAAGIRKHITFHLARHSISYFSLKTNDLQNLNLRQVTI